MASETLSFDIFANDRASETFKRLGLAASGASGDVKTLGDRLDKLGTKVSTARVELDGSKEANAALDQLDVKLIRLGRKVADPNITVEGKVRALADISAVDLAMDRLNKKFAQPAKPGFLSRLLTGALGGFAGGGGGSGAAGNAAGSAAGAAGTGGGGLLSGGTGVAIGAGAASLVTLLSGAGGIIPALAAATAGLAAFGALALPTLTKLIGNSPAWHSLIGVFNSLVAAFKPDVVHLFNVALGILVGLLPQILPFADAAAKAFGGLLDGFRKFASSPQFGVFLDQMNKLTGPAILAIGEGFGKIAIAFGKLLIALTSPDALRILSGLLDVLAGAITVLADVITGATPVIIGSFHGLSVAFDAVRHGFATSFDSIRHVFDGAVRGIQIGAHDISSAFDTVRHDSAVAWDNIWSHTKASLGLLTQGFDGFRHGTAIVFDGLRHDISSAWDLIWSNTKSKVTTGISDVVNFFGALPGKVVNALLGLGTKLWNLGHTWLTDMLSGAESVLRSIENFFTSLPGKILGWLGIHSPPGWAIEAGKHIMTGIGIGMEQAQDRAHQATQAIQRQALLHPTGSGAGVEALMKSMAASIGWTGALWTDLFNVEEREAGFSLTAQNPGSGAYGLAQFINGPSEYYQWGGNPNTARGQITGMLNYIRSTYGTPAGAWQSELTRGFYDRGGWLPTGVSLAVNNTGRPEMVVPSGSGGGARIVIEVSGGAGEFDQFLLRWLHRNARIRGGGNVQLAFG